MEYQLKTKTSEAIDLDPGEMLLTLFEGRISPEQHQFELVKLTSGTFSNIHEHSSLSVQGVFGSVSKPCNPLTIHSREEFPSFFGATDVQEGV
jgi:hypothetical protein